MGKVGASHSPLPGQAGPVGHAKRLTSKQPQTFLGHRSFCNKKGGGCANQDLVYVHPLRTRAVLPQGSQKASVVKAGLCLSTFTSSKASLKAAQARQVVLRSCVTTRSSVYLHQFPASSRILTLIGTATALDRDRLHARVSLLGQALQLRPSPTRLKVTAWY